MRARLLTPPGRGAVAVVELSGRGARERAAALARGRLPAPGELGLVRLAHGGEELDEVLAVARGDGALELHLHGSPPLVTRVLELLGAGPDVDPDVGSEASGGAGTLEERARALLPDAPCEAAARMLLDQAEGALRRACATLSAAPEDELMRGVRALVRRARSARRLLVPARIVLAGPVNAGKSTLFNTLLAEGRAIVSTEGGTTRDALVERTTLGPWPVSLVDTAGEREAPVRGGREAVEREGQRRGRALRARADLVLWLVPVGVGPPADSAPEAALPAGATLLRTQADRAPDGPGRAGAARAGGAGAISALRDPEGARRRVEALLRAALDLPAGDPWEPGAAVPFEVEHERLLAAAAEGPAGETRRALTALLT